VAEVSPTPQKPEQSPLAEQVVPAA
jgi:hypothetical protein